MMIRFDDRGSCNDVDGDGVDDDDCDDEGGEGSRSSDDDAGICRCFQPR